MMSSDLKQPSVEEQIKMETRELERKCMDLTQNLCNKEYEVQELRRELERQKIEYEHTIAELCLKILK